MRTGSKFLAATVALGAAVLGSAAANANPIYFLYSTDNGTTYTQFGAVVDGYNSPSTSVGSYTLISAVGTGSPILTAPNFQTSSIDVKSSAAGNLIVAAIETGLTTPGLSGFQLGFTSNSSSTVPVTTTFSIIDSTNSYIYLSSSIMSPNSATSTFLPYSTTGTYSAVELYTAAFGTGGGSFNATISESGVFVPEPVSMSLLGASLAGLGLIRLRRKS